MAAATAPTPSSIPASTRCATTRPPTPGPSLAAQAEPRGYHSTALLLPDGRIVSAGDDGPSGGGGQSDEIEVFSPPYLFKGARPSIVSAPGPGLLRRAPSRSGRLDTDIAKAVLIAPGATTHANDMDQRAGPADHLPGDRRAHRHGSRDRRDRPARLLHALPGERAGHPVRGKFVMIAHRPDRAAARHHPAHRLVSAPAAGATVTGTTPVSADAADNIGVAGVQFTLDGANLGAEDTSRALLGQLEHDHRHQRRPRPARDRPRRRRQHHHLGPGQRHRLEHRHPAARRPGGRLRLRGDLGHRGRRRLARRTTRARSRGAAARTASRQDRPGDRLRRGQRLRLGGRRQLARPHHRHDPRGLGAAGHRQRPGAPRS